MRDRKLGLVLGVWLVSNLGDLQVGQHGVVQALELPESVQNHLMHMGFVPNAMVTALRRAPAGDPTVYCVDGMEIALRRDTASAIRVKIPRTLSRQQEQELLQSSKLARQESAEISAAKSPLLRV